MTPFDRKAKLAFVVVCTLLVASSIGFKAVALNLQVYLQKQPVELRKKLDTMPATLGTSEMIGQSRKLTAEIVEELGTDDYIERSYAPEGKATRGLMNLHITYYTGLIDAVPHVPDRCLVAAGFKIVEPPRNLALDIDRSGWTPDPQHLYRGEMPYPTVTVVHPVTREEKLVRMPTGDFTIRTTEFSDPKAVSYRVFSGYFFIANGAVAGTPDDVRVISFRPSQKFAYYCKIQLTVMRTSAYTIDDFLDESAGLLEALLPELMQCLPDWSEVEAMDPRA